MSHSGSTARWAALAAASVVLAIAILILLLRLRATPVAPEVSPTDSPHEASPATATAVPPTRRRPALQAVAPDPPTVPAPTEAPAPAIRLDPATIDLGTLELGATVTRRIRVVAPSGASLRVTRPPPFMTAEARPVASGDASELELAFTVASDAIPGPVADSMSLEGGGSSLIVPVKAEILAGVSAEPTLIRPQPGPDGALVLPDVKVSSPGGHDFKILSIEDSQGLIGTGVEKAEDGHYVIHSTIKSIPEGRYMGGTLTIRTSDPRTPVLRVRYLLSRDAR